MHTSKIYIGGVNDMTSETKMADTHFSNRGGANRQWIHLVLCVIAVLFMVMFYGKVDVHAGTIDANGYTVATDLTGNAYTLLVEDGDEKILYFIRSTETLSEGRVIRIRRVESCIPEQ